MQTNTTCALSRPVMMSSAIDSSVYSSSNNILIIIVVVVSSPSLSVAAAITVKNDKRYTCLTDGLRLNIEFKLTFLLH